MRRLFEIVNPRGGYFKPRGVVDGPCQYGIRTGGRDLDHDGVENISDGPLHGVIERGTLYRSLVALKAPQPTHEGSRLPGRVCLRCRRNAPRSHRRMCSKISTRRLNELGSVESKLSRSWNVTSAMWVSSVVQSVDESLSKRAPDVFFTSPTDHLHPLAVFRRVAALRGLWQVKDVARIERVNVPVALKGFQIGCVFRECCQDAKLNLIPVPAHE